MTITALVSPPALPSGSPFNCYGVTTPQPAPGAPEPMPQSPPEYPDQVPPEVEEPEVPGEHEPMHDPQMPPPIVALH